MKKLFVIPIVLFFTSCCSPRYITDPLYLELQQVSPGCPLSSCKGDDPDCKARPWTNIEYDFGKNKTLKIGQYYQGYGTKMMVSGGVNWLHQSRGLNGFNVDIQAGWFPVNGFFTVFTGLEYSRYNKSVESQVISPTLGYCIPSKYLNNIQLKTGYNIGLNSNRNEGFYFGVSALVPIAAFFGL